MKKNIFKIMTVIIMTLFFTFYLQETPADMSSNKDCNEPRSLKTQVYRAPMLPTIGLVWIDKNCDNICDEVVMLEYLGRDSAGKHIFNPIGVLTCEEADQFHRDAEKNTKNRSI